MVKTQFGFFVQKVHSDNGMEFMNPSLQAYLLEHGILQETSFVDDPNKMDELNGKTDIS